MVFSETLGGIFSTNSIREDQNPTRTHVVSYRRSVSDTPPTPADRGFENASAAVRCPGFYSCSSGGTVPRILQ